MTPPDVALTAPGLCHNLPLAGHARAGEPYLMNGTAVAPVYLGTLAGSEVEVDVGSLAEMG